MCYHDQRTTQGQSSWLGFHCKKLSFSTPNRFIPALSEATSPAQSQSKEGLVASPTTISYMTGGPLSDRRLIGSDEKEVWFWARPKRSTKPRQGMNSPEPFRLSGSQLMQRWTLHILPKGFTRSRQYGGYHGTKRAKYIAQCRELLGSAAETADPSPIAATPDRPSEAVNILDR